MRIAMQGGVARLRTVRSRTYLRDQSAGTFIQSSFPFLNSPPLLPKLFCDGVASTARVNRARGEEDSVVFPLTPSDSDQDLFPDLRVEHIGAS